MKDDDDDEVGFDLTAWEAPPPPAGIADAVIAQLRTPAAKPAVEQAPARKLRWWMIAAPLVAASVIGVVAISVATGGADEVSGSGAVATAKPSHLELGGTVVDLEANTDVWWVRDGKRMVAMQPRGVATWKVAAGDELVIDAGATVASVSASGASLRVEVEMNLSDARLIGTSAVTAAAVALVTVIVYEGHVKVTGGDKTVDVPAGSTVQIAPNKAPVEPDRTADVENRLRSKIQFLELEIDLLRKKLDPAWLTPQDILAFQTAMKPVMPALRRCRLGSTASEITLHVEVRDPNDTKLGIDAQPAVEQKVFECVDKQLAKVSFASIRKGAYSYAVTFEDRVATVRPPAVPRQDAKDSPFIPVKPPTTVEPAPPSVKCDDKRAVDEIEAKGDAAASAGAYAAALKHYETILKCRSRVLNKTYLMACRARNFPRAKTLFKQIGRESLTQICLKEGFDPR